MAGRIDKEFAATVLLEAVYLGDEKAAQRNDITIKTIQRYRKLWAGGDTELSHFVAMKRAALDREWAQKLPAALDQAIEFIATAAAAGKEDQMLKRNPMMISAVAGAMKLLADVFYTGKVINARLAQTDRPADDVSRQIPAEDDEPAGSFVN